MVLLPYLVDVDEPPLAWAESEMLNAREHQHFVFCIACHGHAGERELEWSYQLNSAWDITFVYSNLKVLKATGRSRAVFLLDLYAL